MLPEILLPPFFLKEIKLNESRLLARLVSSVFAGRSAYVSDSKLI